MYKSIYEKYIGECVRVHLQNGSVVGKLKKIDADDHAFDLEGVISTEPGKKVPEITLTDGSFYFNNLIGMVRVSLEYYKELQQPQSIVKYIDKFVCIDAFGKYNYGKIVRITPDSIELLPFMHAKIKDGKSETYMERTDPFILNSKSINSIMPSTEETIAGIIDKGNKEE